MSQTDVIIKRKQNHLPNMISRLKQQVQAGTGSLFISPAAVTSCPVLCASNKLLNNQ